MIGVDTPHYHRRKKAGELLPMNPFTQVEWSLSRSGSYSYGNTQYGEWRHGDGPPLAGDRYRYQPSEGHITDLVSSIDTAFLLQMAAANLNAEFDALTFLVELREIPELLLGLVTRIHNLRTSAYKRFNVKNVGDLWLEVRYGWRPLLNDMESIARLLNEAAEKKSEFVKRRTGAAIAQSFTDVVTMSWSVEHAGAVETTQVDSTIAVSGVARVVSKIQPPKVMISVPVTAWEVIPLSFVLDWIVGVGTALKALSALSVHTDLVSSVGTRVDIEATGSGRWDATLGYASLNLSSSYSEVRTLRTPQAVTFVPRLKVHLDEFKAIDLTFIAIQRIRSHRNR